MKKKTAKIGVNKIWKLIHGHETYSNNLVSKPHGDFLLGIRTLILKINVKNWKNLQYL